MALDGCGLLCKYTLLIFNLIFALVGFVFLGLGLWLRFSDSTRAIFEFEALDSSAFVIAVTILIITGSVMLIVVVFGDYGACSEKRCALQIFSALVAILGITVVVLGVINSSRSDEIGLSMGEFYSSIYLLYVANSDPVLAVTLTFIQKLLHCCGATGITSLDFAKETCPKPDTIWEHIKMDACPGVIINVFNDKAPLVMGLFVGTGVFLLLALICSSTLSKKLINSSTPQYMILTQPPPSHLEYIPTSTSISYSFPNQPVVFTPLTVANIPIVIT
ncbi:CD9 antigen-like isoform X1 [Trematomus bernacchii]|uniref:CD9 antigen-like isoform X1 n=1 Tax=Trematomus bernacchii TaxID=40690 RepID=UPI00146E5839|nr:CD9 antigen-like isoform X1 [Trematomus bernacchii]